MIDLIDLPFADDLRSVVTPELPLALADERTGLFFPPASPEMETGFKAGSRSTSHPLLILVTREGGADAELLHVRSNVTAHSIPA